MSEEVVDENHLTGRTVMYYPVGGTANSRIGEPGEIEVGERAMIVFLSFPYHSATYKGVEAVLRSRGLTVYTNFDRTDVTGAVRRTDLRLGRIFSSDFYVHFDDPDHSSVIRQIEYGYALGSEVPVAFVGDPTNSLYRYGENFDSVDHFLAEFYSSEYLERVSQWYPDRERQEAVA